jgi:HrpA-like RNA helicase
MPIPYRDEQILRILAANPAGLTTGQILAIAKSQRGNELPDSNITSQRIYSMRETKTPKLKSIDSPAGRIHKITDAGLNLLNEIDAIDNRRAIRPEAALAAEIPANPDLAITPALAENPPNQADLTDPVDILAQFDSAAAIIRESLITALNIEGEPIKINDKRAKIEFLEKLENMPFLEPWAAELIAEIRADLNQLEAA